MLGLQCLQMTMTSIISEATSFFSKIVKLGTLKVPVWLLLVWAVGIVLSIVMIVLLASLSSKEKKLKAQKEAEKTENTPVESVENTEDNAIEETPVEDAQETVVEETPVEEETIAPVEETPVEETAVVEETAEEEETPVEEVTEVTEEAVEEVAPVEEETVAPVEEAEVIAPVEEVAVEDATTTPVEEENNVEKDDETMTTHEENTKIAVGKLNYYLTESGYYFSVNANNGQELFVSYSFTTLDGAKKGFETFANAVNEGNFIVSEDKNGRFRYILNKKYQGPNYKTRSACESSVESIKKFSHSYKVNEIEPDEETKKAFENYSAELKKGKKVDWDAIAKEEAETPKSGSFEIEESDGGYRFYLYANNRQILYSSNIYASALSATKGIDAFKKAVYTGVVVFEKDKFSNYRYILRNSYTVTYVGESFTNEASARSQFESVKRFVKSATIVPYKKKVVTDEVE